MIFLTVKDLYITEKKSYREIANILKVKQDTTIASWVKTFRLEGIDGLSRKKGRPSTMIQKKKDGKITDQERIKKLEKQVRSLEIENAFLKELGSKESRKKNNE